MVIDMHCDTISELLHGDKKQSLAHNDLCVNLENMHKAGTWIQYFACFVNAGKYERELRHRQDISSPSWERAWSEVMHLIERLRQEESDELRIVHTCKDAEALCHKNVVAALTTVEEGGVLNGRISRLEELYEKGVRLMGFGHRVYKNYDPRAAIVKETAHEVLAHLGGDELLDLAMKLEEIALADDYFVSRKLYPNVDFYTGLIYRAMGFPTEFFTVLFAIGRLPGWIAQFREQLALNTKINRPRQIYTGEAPRSFVPRSER